VCIDDIDNSRIVEYVHIPSEVTSNVVDELLKSSTPTFDIHVPEESINDVQDALVESSTLSHSVRCSLSTPTIEEKIEHKMVTTSVDTNESLGFLLIVCQVISSVCSFSNCLEFFCKFI